jgi:hypothetical protein
MVYDKPIHYAVPKLGYYCVGESQSDSRALTAGVVPVTLRGETRRELAQVESRQADGATHATFSGSILFRNQFKGELAAAEYPKIGVS